jgi:nicotinic acid mononucleotide adenylyltransferase
LQPPYAALMSGAFHPTAEGHAIVADHVLRHVNQLLENRAVAARNDKWSGRVPGGASSSRVVQEGAGD